MNLCQLSDLKLRLKLPEHDVVDDAVLGIVGVLAVASAGGN